MKRIALLIVISGLAAVMWGAAMPCAAPPFAAKVVRPNIILMFDNSGSMGDEPHSVMSITVGTPNDTFSWYGYFDPKKKYSYASNRFFEDPAGPYPGNILNWVTMSRGDILRKVLTGGRASSTGGGIATLRTEGRNPGQTYTYRRDASNYTTFYMDHDGTSLGRLDVSWTGASAPIQQTANDMRVQVEIPIANYRGVIHQIGDEDRDDQWDPDAPAFGLWFFHINNPTPEAGFVMDYIGDPTVTLSQYSNHIRNQPFTTNTPHAETYFEITHYVSQADPHYQNGDYTKNPGGNKDPYWDQRLADTLWCARTFVICMTDGESTLDATVPNSDGDVPACNNLLTMGRPYTQNNGFYFDEVAYYAHTTDLRQTGYRPLHDMQEITLFTIYTFSTGVAGDSLLNLAAKVGGFVDKNGNHVPDLQNEWDEDANGQADNYFRATNGQQLEAAILKAISMIMARVASGSPTAVVSSGARSEGLVYQSLFWPRKFEGTDMIDWSGRMHSLWIDRYGYMHEDSDGDRILSIKNDNVVKMDTTIGMAELWRDTSGRGIDSLLRYVGTVHIDNLRHVWNGGKMLHLRSPATREIYTWVDNNANGVVDAGEYIPFDVGNVNDIRQHLDVNNNNDTALALIQYIRGQDITGRRNRTVLGNVWKLGDVIYSGNTYVGKPQEGYSLIYYDVTYRNFYNKYKLATPPVIADSSRADAIYVGANDGMLHCFNAGKFVTWANSVSDTAGYLHWWGADEPGKELWAYIPFNLLPHLKWLWDNNYCHVYYVDLKPYATDAKIFDSTDNVHRHGWGTLLIGGMRLGGTPITVGTQTYRSAYFAFDVTKAKDGAAGLPKLLWEFTDPQLRYTTSYPVVVKVKNSWFLVFGSGPATLSGTAASATAQLYVLDLKTGLLRRKFSLPAGDSIVGDITAVDVGLNYSNELIYFGTYNSRGGSGKLWRISTKGLAPDESENPNDWLMSVVIDAARPVVGAPGITLDYRNNLWVYFGTGRYYNALDEADLTAQRFYGIKDDGSLINLAQLLDVTNVIVKGDTAYGLGAPMTYDSLIARVEARKGWYRDFTTGGVGQGERCWTKPLVIGGAVVFTTGTPSGGDVCLFGGTGDLYAVFYLTGAAYKKEILGKNMAGEHLVKVSLGSGIPAGAGLYIGSDREKAFIQSATGGIRGIQMRLPFSPREGVQVYKRR